MNRTIAQPVPAAALTAAPATLQRKCACGTHTMNGECAECGRNREGTLQRKAAGFDSAAENHAPQLVHDVLRSPGRPLDTETRAFFEPRFGRDFGDVRTSGGALNATSITIASPGDGAEMEADRIAERVAGSPPPQRGVGLADFSRVRVHTDARAAESARAINARAYAVGGNIVFADRQYSPHTAGGRELIAHELAHVVQAGGAPSTQANRKLYRSRFDTNEEKCTATMTYLVQLLFKDHGKDTWDKARKQSFRSKFKQSIEGTFNNNSFNLKPSAASFQSGLVFKETKSCPCATTGFKPLVQINLVKDGELSSREDWEVDLMANPSGGYIQSESNTSYGTTNEAGVIPIEKASSAPGVKQAPAVHEFGHFIGLDHPGEGLEGSIISKSKLSPGATEYSHTGKDKKGRDVDGPNDLMGSGMGLRPFYFDNWLSELQDKYGKGCGWQTQ